MKRFVLIAITLIVSSVSYAQSEVSMGKIPVYTFAMDSLYYEGRGKQLSAVGTEHMADLYMTNMGGANYYKIVIGGETFAVMKDSYGLGVSSGYCWLYKDGKYKQLTGLPYKAGQYYLTLPFGQQNASTTNPNQTSSSTTSIENQKPALDWHPIGKVKAVKNLRVVHRSGEDDINEDSEVIFIYSAFNGETVKYQASIPGRGVVSVSENSSYNHAQIHWRKDRVSYVPSLDEMYSHYAGGFYFNLADVKQ